MKVCGDNATNTTTGTVNADEGEDPPDSSVTVPEGMK